MQEIDEKHLRPFVGENSDYYVTKWSYLRRTGSKLSWNWPAALVTSFWLAYRRMYFYLLLYFAASFFFSLNMATSLGFFVLSIAVGGALGNYLYFAHAQRKTALHAVDFEEKSDSASELSVDQLGVIATAGGTSKVAVVVVFLIYVILILFAAFFGVLALAQAA